MELHRMSNILQTQSSYVSMFKTGWAALTITISFFCVKQASLTDSTLGDWSWSCQHFFSHYLQLHQEGRSSWGKGEHVRCRAPRPCKGRWTVCAPGCRRTWWTCRALLEWTSPGPSRRTQCAGRSPSGPPDTWCEPSEGESGAARIRFQ